VFSTLHANSAAGTLQRLVDIGLRTDMLAGSLGGIIAQRLVRRLCPDCRTEVVASPEACRLLGLDSASLPRIFHPVGCPACDFRGYRGRLAIMELVRIDPALDELIHQGASLGRLRAALRAGGHASLAEDGIRRVLDGSTSLAELTRVVDLAAHADERGAPA
jgi:general secretion pathway protein E/type IV pilus assembly protein PilB